MFSEDLRLKIREAYELKKSYRQVGRDFNISHQSVKYIVENDYNRSKEKRGPEIKTKREEIKNIKREVRRMNNEGEKVTARKVMTNLEIDNISDRTMRRNLGRIGFDHNKAAQSIPLTAEQRKKRVAYAEDLLAKNHPFNRTAQFLVTKRNLTWMGPTTGQVGPILAENW